MTPHVMSNQVEKRPSCSCIACVGYTTAYTHCKPALADARFVVLVVLLYTTPQLSLPLVVVRFFCILTTLLFSHKKCSSGLLSVEVTCCCPRVMESLPHTIAFVRKPMAPLDNIQLPSHASLAPFPPEEPVRVFFLRPYATVSALRGFRIEAYLLRVRQ